MTETMETTVSTTMANSESMSQSVSQSLSQSQSVSSSQSMSQTQSESQSFSQSTSMTNSQTQVISQSLASSESQSVSQAQSESAAPQPYIPPHKNLYGIIHETCCWWNDDEQRWVKARFQSPFPTPTHFEDHIVQPGEKLWEIACTYGVSLGWMKMCNHKVSDKIRVGDRLKVTYTPSYLDDFLGLRL